MEVSRAMQRLKVVNNWQSVYTFRDAIPYSTIRKLVNYMSRRIVFANFYHNLPANDCWFEVMFIPARMFRYE